MLNKSFYTKSKRMAYFLVVIAAILWGTLGIYGRTLNKIGFEPIQTVFLRAFGASLMLFLYALIKDKRLLIVKPRDFMYFIGTGILSFAFFNLCYFTAINNTSLSITTILLYTAPAIVTVLSAILFKEKMTNKKVISLILTFIGCVFVTAFVNETKNKSNLFGILAGLGSGFGYALYSIFGRYALKKYDSVTVTLYTFVFASIGLISFIDIREIIDLSSNIAVIFYSISLALFATVLPFLFYTISLSYLETSKASIVATLEPIVATIIGVILYKEQMTVFKLLGILLVIYAVSMLRENGNN